MQASLSRRILNKLCLHLAEVGYNRLGFGWMADQQAVGVLVVKEWHNVGLEQLSQVLNLHLFDFLDQFAKINKPL